MDGGPKHGIPFTRKCHIKKGFLFEKTSKPQKAFTLSLKKKPNTIHIKILCTIAYRHQKLNIAYNILSVTLYPFGIWFLIVYLSLNLANEINQQRVYKYENADYKHNYLLYPGIERSGACSFGLFVRMLSVCKNFHIGHIS
jgi:hypothetical protein